MKINGKAWESMEKHYIQCKSMVLNGKAWESMETNEKAWNSIKSMETNVKA